jgi:hypothetical protein
MGGVTRRVAINQNALLRQQGRSACRLSAQSTVDTTITSSVASLTACGRGNRQHGKPLERFASRPTRDEMLARIHGRKRVTLKTPAATVIRHERESA